MSLNEIQPTSRPPEITNNDHDDDARGDKTWQPSHEVSTPIAVVTPEIAAAFGLASLPKVVVLDNPPPGGWIAADRVPDKYRRGYVAPKLTEGNGANEGRNSFPSCPSVSVKALPPRPGLRRPSFAKVV